MSLKEKLQADLKAAMIARDTVRADVIKGIKSSILYAEVASGNREQGLSDDEIIKLLQKEAKKRTESAELYAQGGRPERQQAELAEKAIIDDYLPAQMSESELTILVDQAIEATGASGIQAMGQVIGAVKTKAGSAGDGALIAKLVKQKLGN